MYVLGVTDLQWHAQLLDGPPPGLVNFWTPTPWSVRVQPGVRWFFMLKHPVRRIGGFGLLVSYEDMTVSKAWDRFGAGNGAANEADFRKRVTGYAAKRASRPAVDDPVIGCVSLSDCVFLPPELQPTPEALRISFPPQVVKYKTFPGELALPVEAEMPDTSAAFTLLSDAAPDLAMRRSKRRVGQQLFRGQVLDAYGDTCALTRTRCREALEAAHIQPFIALASNHVQNGLALRRDIHALYDAGLLSVTPEGRIAVSSLLAGTEYGHLADQVALQPSNLEFAPSRAALAHHFKSVFRP